jgi:hypothetical protein
MKNANRKIEELHDKNATLLRSNKRIQKRIERLRADELPFPVNLGSIDVRTLRSLDAVLVNADGPSFGELTTIICLNFLL